MPGWYIHLHVARAVADLLSNAQYTDGSALGPNGTTISTFSGAGKTPTDLSDIIQRYPNYYALGAIGPDIFFLLPDFKGEEGNFIAKLAQWVIEFYDQLDTQVIEPWENFMGPIEENQTEAESWLTGGLSDQISQITNIGSGIVTNAILGFATRLYDWFSIFSSGVGAGYDDKLFFWSDMFHYRNTNEFGRDLFHLANISDYTAEGPTGAGQYEPGIAFALGWMTHIGTDVTGHPFVNEKSGGPARLHWQRHHLVENHMDAYVYEDQHGAQERYNTMANSALHFWVQFDRERSYGPKYNYLVLNYAVDNFPQYDTGQTARNYFNRKNSFDAPSDLPPPLAQFLLHAMRYTFYDRHNQANNGGVSLDGGNTYVPGMEPHPMILAAIKPDQCGRPDTELMNTTYALLYKFLKYTTTDYYKLPKPDPPELFPNLDPPMPPGGDDAPGAQDSSWNVWDLLLAVLAWILYVAEWIEYVVTIIPAMIADLGTYGVRVALYLLEEGLYEIWKAFRYLLVMEGFIIPEPDEIDLGLIQLGQPSNGPFQGLLAIMNDVFGGLLGDNPNPPPQSEPVNDPLYPKNIVMDDESLLSQFVGTIKEWIGPTCGLPEPCHKRAPSEFLRPWEYPLLNNDHSPIDMELGHTRAGFHPAGSLPVALLGHVPGVDQARKAYEDASTPADTDNLNAFSLNESWNMGDPVFYSLYVMGQLTRENLDSTEVANFNLDADRGYGYKCWDWDRHQPPANVPDTAPRSLWKPAHWYVSEPRVAGAKCFTFLATPINDASWLTRYFPQKALDTMREKLLAPTTVALALEKYGDETSLWKAVLSQQLGTDFPGLNLPDLTPQWIVPSDSVIQGVHPGNKDGYAEATGLVIKVTHPNAHPWSISNDDMAFNHSVIPYETGHDDEGDTGWKSYRHYDVSTEGNNQWKAERLAAHTHLLDINCTTSEISHGDWYYRDREFPLLLDPKYRHLLSVGNSEDGDLLGCLGLEAESWQLDPQVMPRVGDRMYVAGRWIVDNGHEELGPNPIHKHMEIHFPYVVVRQFRAKADAPFSTDRNSAPAASEEDAVVDVVVFVTGAWPGGNIEFDVFPPVRLNPSAVAQIQQQQIAPIPFNEEEPARYQNSTDIKIQTVKRRNHIHFVVSAPTITFQPTELRLGQQPVSERRHIAAFRIGWRTNESITQDAPAVTTGQKTVSVDADEGLLRDWATAQINDKYSQLGGSAKLGAPVNGLVMLRENTEHEALLDLGIDVPQDQIPAEYRYREPISHRGYFQEYANHSGHSAIVWSNRAGAHFLSPQVFDAWSAFCSQSQSSQIQTCEKTQEALKAGELVGRILFPTRDSYDSGVFAVDSFGNEASIEIDDTEKGSTAYVAVYDPLGDVLTGLRTAYGTRKGDLSKMYWVPCTPPEQFNKNDICCASQTNDCPLASRDIALDYDPLHPLLIHYLKMLKRGETYSGCKEEPLPARQPEQSTIG